MPFEGHVHKWVITKGEERWHRCKTPDCLAVGDKEIPASFGRVEAAFCHDKDCADIAVWIGDTGVWCELHHKQDADSNARRRSLAQGGMGCLRCFRRTGRVQMTWYAGAPAPESAWRCAHCGITWYRFADPRGAPMYVNLREKPPDKPMSAYIADLMRRRIGN